MSRPLPAVGEVVHYQPFDLDQGQIEWGCQPRTGQPWAALVTEIHEDGMVGLQLFHPAGQVEERVDENHPCRHWYAEHPTPGHWSWPRRSQTRTDR